MGHKLETRIATWKKLLLDMGKRNRLINFRESKRSNVQITHPSCDVIFDIIAIQDKHLTFPYSKKVLINEEGEEIYESIISGDFETNKTISDLQKTLKVIRYRAKTSIEEQGINTLYLTFGMLKWRENDSSSFFLHSPVVLVPVKLTLESLTSPYVLSLHEDEIVVNPTLQHKLENDYGIQLPDFDECQDSISNYLAECIQIVENKGWEIDKCVHLTNLSFLKINMYKDLERNEDRLCAHPVISAIAGENDPIQIPNGLDNYDHDKLDRPIDVFQVVDADSSQQDAILLSKKNVSFVLQGPPGTGKSQTITNIISEALADGKKVLFVSEKKAALQVVFNRLSNVGLSDFCFTLHSHKVNKKEILQELANSISINRKKVRNEALAQLDVLEKKRSLINDYQEQLHTPCSALNVTVFEINGKLSKLKDVPDIVFPIPNVEKINIHELNNIIYLLGELSKTIGKRSEDYEKNIWRGSTISFLSNELRHDIDSNVTELNNLLGLLDKKISECDSALSHKSVHSFWGANDLLALLNVLRKSPLLLEVWFNRDYNQIISQANKYRNITDTIKNLKDSINDNYNQSILNTDVKEVIKSLTEDERKLLAIFKYNDKDIFVSKLSERVNKLKENSKAISDIKSGSKKVASMLGIDAPTTFNDLKDFERKLNALTLIVDIKPTDIWFNQEGYSHVKDSLSIYRQTHEDYVAKVSNLLNQFDKEILELDCYPIIRRFRSEYRSIFRVFNNQYRKDLRCLRSFSKNGQKISFTEANIILDHLKEIADSKEQINEISDNCKSYYGDRYQGIDTNWEIIREDIEKYEQFGRDFVRIPLLLQNIISNGDIPKDDITQFVIDFKSSDIHNKIIDLLRVLKIDDTNNTSIGSILEKSQNAIRVAESFESKFRGVQSYRNKYTTYCNLISELNNIISYQSAYTIIDSEKDYIQGLFGSYYEGINTNWECLYNAINYVGELKNVISEYSLPKNVISGLCADSSFVRCCNDMYEELYKLQEHVRNHIEWFASLFGEKSSFKDMNLIDLSEWLLLCKNNKNQLEEWVDYCANRKKCVEVGLSYYIETIENKLINEEYIVDAYLKRFYRLWLDRILPQLPAVRDFRSRVHEQNIQEFQSLDTNQFLIARARVRERVISRIPDFNVITTSRDEIGVLKRELNKKRRIMPLRKLFMKIPNLISIMKPCFMMSPLSVSLFLEAKSYEFDMVVFDEASQVHTEDAVGAIMRGKQVIIVGDTKQLPPTNFFTTSLNDEDFDLDENDEETDNDAGAYESILDEAVTVLPERSLQWHYRSRDESLIAFSNLKIYNGSLITFPSAIEKSRDMGVEYVYVADGVYDRGGKKCNMQEAKRVAQLVFEHFLEHPNRSLGVVTFSEAQQNAVDMAIRQIRVNNNNFEKFFSDSKAEPFFVKNLENVQGDERDTIIFSIGYAKDSHGIMYMNFGPLSREGGYRRLNVAITRAKYNVKLVGSIQATDINLEKTSAEGVKMLRSYIEYAQQGISAINKELEFNYDLNFDSPFEESVYDFLSEKGYHVVTQVGCSGYRIDMAIKHPSLAGKFAIGIECDGATYHNTRTARERDRLRQMVLEDMGWHIYRIWSTDWIKNQKSEEEKLIEEIEKMISCTGTIDNEEYTSTSMDISEIEEPVKYESEVSNGYDFDTYRSVHWNDLWDGDITSTLRKVIETLQPVHFDVLCRILAPLWGNQKVTNVVRNGVNNYLRHLLDGVVEKKGDFVSLTGFNNLRVRVPDNPDEIRAIEYISEDELALALTVIANHSIGIDSDNLIVEAARVYGFKRTGGRIYSTLKKVYDNLIAQGKLKEVDGKVN